MERIKIAKLEPEAYRALYSLERYLSATKVSVTNRNLIKLRASQINGCAYCLNMHSKEAREAGETEQRIYLLNAWREVETIFTAEEKAILALTEEVTLITGRVSDATYNNAASFFDEHHLAQIIMTIVAINAWNRIAISTHLQPE